MKKLFLTSSFSDVSQFLEGFIGDTLTNKTITFIPTGSLVEEYRGYVDNDKKAFEKLGIIIEELEISNSSLDLIEQVITKNDYIYVSGGNTFYLLQELKKSGADKIIVDEIQKGKPYIGASAGSIVMSKNIKYVEKMDDREKAKYLTDDNALGVVDFYPLPHHTNEPFKNIVEKIIEEYENSLKLMAISNTEVIEFTEKEIKINGKK